MSSHSAASIYLAAMLAAGVGTGFLLEPGLVLSASLAACLLFLFFLALKGVLQKAYWVISGLAFMAMGIWSMATVLPKNQPEHYLNHLHSETQSLEIRILETLKPGKFRQRYTGEVRYVDGHRTKGKILLEIRKDSSLPALESGQHIYTPVLPSPFTYPANPGGFDYGAYMKSQGIYSRLKLTEHSFLRSDDSPFRRETPVIAIRQKLLNVLEGIGLGRSETPIAKALLLGERSEVDPDLHAAYKKAGVLHLLAISGLHIGVLTAFLFACLSPLKRMRYGKGVQTILGLLVLWGYALIAGFSPSVVRAVVLYSFVALSLYLERPGQTLHFLGLSWMFMLILIDPNFLTQVGFQLSFAAVAAIVVFYPFLFRYWPLKRPPFKYFGKLIAVSLAAQLGTLPFTLYYFHEFPGLFLLSNLVLLPGIGVILVSGLVCLTLGVFDSLPGLMAHLLDQFLRAMNSYVHWASGMELFFIEDITLNLPEFILSVLAILLLGIYHRADLKNAVFGFAVILLVFQGVGISHEAIKQRSRNWLIPHQVANTMVWMREGSHFMVHGADSLSGAFLIRDALKFWDLDTVEFSPLTNRYDMDGLYLRVLDSSGLYSPAEPRPDFLLLSGSPKVHLGRLLQALRPGVVIADGSNYTSDLNRWERSCKLMGIPFHPTAKEGAYAIKPAQK